MATEHPFQMLFETLGRVPTAHAESVNRRAYEVLYDILSVPVEKPGRCVLLRAPRAGHGKTHLLSRIQHQLGSTHEFIPLHAAFGCQIDASTVIDDALRRLLRPLPASGGLCVLDLVARRLFAAALQPLVGSGEVPCQDREGALAALRTRPIETFDFHHPNAVTAHWTRENFEVLGQRLSVELAQRCNLPIREVAFWVDALFRFAATPVENPIRLRVIAEAVHAGNPSANEMMERLEALLGLLAQLMRVVLVADELEGFSSDESSALKLAAFLGALRQSVERLDVILSLNQDVWEGAFVPRLSGGLADRLSEVVVELQPLTEDEMVALLESRVPGLGKRVLSRVDRSAAGTHARGLIRAAGVAWLKASAMDSRSNAPVSSPPPPPHVPPAIPTDSPPVETPVQTEAVSVPSMETVSPPSTPASDAQSEPEEVVDADKPVSISPAGFPSEPVAEYADVAEVPEPPPSTQIPEAKPEPASSESPQPSSVYGSEAPPSLESQPPEPETKLESQTVDAPGSTADADTDRVDDLLRQFRERYGRGSL